MSEPDTILTATRAAHVDLDGHSVLIRPGTTVRVGHALVESYPGLFEPIRVQYDIEAVTETADATPAAVSTVKPGRAAKPTETR